MNGSHQDQIFDNLAALCIALWARNQIQLVEGWVGAVGGWGGGGTNAPYRLFLKGAKHFLSLFYFYFFLLQDLLCLRSSRPKYNASKVSCFFFFFFF